MVMEPLGGSMPAGRPVAVATGNRSHVFAIAAGGGMNHWISRDGGLWTGPTQLPNGNLVASVPCAIALPDGSVHVFAIANGGGLTHWSSPDGDTWTHRLDPSVPIPGGWNGLAVASPGGQRLDVFATTAGGIIQFTYDGDLALRGPLPDSVGYPVRLLEAVSPAPGQLDVFVVDPNIIMPVRWHFNGSWSPKQILGTPMHRNSGLAAVVTPAGSVELFGITPDMRMISGSIVGQTFIPKGIPPGPWPLPDGIPAAIARDGTIDLFAIGQGGVGQGGPLVHWRFDGVRWGNPVAYSSGLAAGGVTAVRGMAGLEAFGIQSGLDNCLLHWPAGIAATGHDPWRNWAANRQTQPEGHCYPQSLEELVAIVKGATRQGKRVRAVGSSWSFSDIAVTPGYIVETKHLNKILTNVLPRALVPGATSIAPIPNSTPAPKHFVHVEAGIILEDLMTFLDEHELAPATMGGAAGQTLAGVISTCVHGSHFRLPPFPDWVRALHLVGPDGRQHWIEPQDRPITNAADDDKLLREALGPEVAIKRNNDWFDSALVTVGSLGIVYSVILEVREAYKLREARTAMTWEQLRPRLEDSSVFTDNAPDAVQIAIDPGSMNKADPDCYLTVRDKLGMSFPSTPADTSFDPQAAFCEGHLLEILYRIGSPTVFGALLGILAAIPVVNVALAGMMPVLGPIIATDQAVPLLYTVLKAGGPGAVGDFLGKVIDKHPGLTAPLISEITRSAQRPGGGVDLAHQVMARRNRGECIARGLALEVAIDTAAGAHLRFAAAAIKLLQAEAAAGRFLGGWFSLRFVGKSRAILSPQQTEMTCMIEFVGLRTLSSTQPMLAKLEALAREHDAIQHWGMFDDLTADDVARAYPRLDTWREVRWELTSGGTVHTFDNDFTSRCGLSSPPRPQPPIGQVRPGNAIALVRQAPGWGSIPLASVDSDGSWNITNGAAPQLIPDWAHQPGVRLIPGDFNGDGLTDIALVRQTPGWGSIPIAFANGDGTWTITNGAAPQFITDWANQPGVSLVPGRFNSDGKGLTDIALVRQTPGWGSIPIAFANGDGTWRIANGAAPQFITDWAHQPGVRVVFGDFNGDGLTDIALVRQTPGWESIPIAFANGDGTWTITNSPAPQFTDWARQPGVRLIAGDFNGNGLTDIALVRQTPGWGSIPIAFANGDGTWTVTNGPAPQFITDWAHQPGVGLVPGDFNGNGLTDIALVRQTPGWGSIPIAFANGDGTWTITNGPAPQLATDWARQPGVRPVAGDFNRDGLTDIALVRQGLGWGSIPVAFANGDGTWTVANGAAPQFIPDWAHQSRVRLIPGTFVPASPDLSFLVPLLLGEPR